MTLEPSPTTANPPDPGAHSASKGSPPETAQRRAKFRLRFRKAGSLRLVSHHDLMHCFERMLRRAELPICTTQGFHPQPRMIFAQSLALGVIGCAEVLELEMSQPLTPEDVQARLVRQAPPGLEILHTRSIDVRASARVRRAFFRLEVPTPFANGLADRCSDLLDRSEVWVERTRPKPRRFNLRPFVHHLTFTPPSLEMALWVTPNGSARPEEVARLLGLEPLLDEGAYFERFHLELADEVAADCEQPPASLLARPDPESASSLFLPVDQADDSTEKARPADKPAAQPSSLIQGPLSFDS